MTGRPIEWVKQGQRTIRVGDLIRKDASKARYRITGMVRLDSGLVEITAYGGKGGRLASRVFYPSQVIVCRSQADESEPIRGLVHEVSEASKKRKVGARR